MEKLVKVLDSLIYRIIALCLLALVSICFLQVFARYVMNSALSWANEISIAVMTWAVWLSVCLIIKRHMHLRVDLIEKRMSLRQKEGLYMIFNITSIIFMVFITYSSRIVFSAMNNMQMTSIPAIPLNIVYIAVPVGAVFVILFVIEDFMGHWRTFFQTHQ